MVNLSEDEQATVVLAEPLLTADDVAQLLAVPRSTVYEYARRRRDGLPSIAVGRHRRFYRSDVERWRTALESRRSPLVKRPRQPAFRVPAIAGSIGVPLSRRRPGPAACCSRRRRRRAA